MGEARRRNGVISDLPHGSVYTSVLFTAQKVSLWRTVITDRPPLPRCIQPRHEVSGETWLLRPIISSFAVSGLDESSSFRASCELQHDRSARAEQSYLPHKLVRSATFQGHSRFRKHSFLSGYSCLTRRLCSFHIF